jgi:hypothetical protein
MSGKIVVRDGSLKMAALPKTDYQEGATLSPPYPTADYPHGAKVYFPILFAELHLMNISGA